MYLNALRRYFTLVELLIVVAIITILAALLLPSLNKARASVRRIVCASNQRQVGMGVQNYMNDNAGWVYRYGAISDYSWVTFMTNNNGVGGDP